MIMIKHGTVRMKITANNSIFYASLEINFSRLTINDILLMINTEVDEMLYMAFAF